MPNGLIVNLVVLINNWKLKMYFCPFPYQVFQRLHDQQGQRHRHSGRPGTVQLQTSSPLWLRSPSWDPPRRIRRNSMSRHEQVDNRLLMMMVISSVPRSVTRLSTFSKFIAAYFLIKVAQIFANFFVYFEVCQFLRKYNLGFTLGNCWKIWVTFNSNIWSHWRQVNIIRLN